MATSQKPVVRSYKMEDELMETRAQVMQDNLEADLALFTDKFPFIDSTYSGAFKTDIETARNFVRDTQVQSDQKVLTENVNIALATAGVALTFLDVYAQVAFPDEKAKQRAFGQDGWQKAKKDQEKMRFALLHAHNMANKAPYKAELLAKGYTQVAIDALLTLADDIEDKNELQEGAKSNRPVTTESRIKAHNTVWSRQRIISLCSQVVFADDPAKLNQYQLYPDSNESTEVIVHVQAPGTGLPRENASVSLTNTSLTTHTTDVNGNAIFNSTDMPDLVDVKASFGGVTVNADSQSVLQGDTVTIMVEV